MVVSLKGGGQKKILTYFPSHRDSPNGTPSFGMVPLVVGNLHLGKLLLLPCRQFSSGRVANRIGRNPRVTAVTCIPWLQEVWKR